MRTALRIIARYVHGQVFSLRPSLGIRAAQLGSHPVVQFPSAARVRLLGQAPEAASSYRPPGSVPLPGTAPSSGGARVQKFTGCRKAIMGLIVTPLLFLCSYYDKPFMVWSLLHPKLPVLELPKPQIDMREAEKKLEKLMETARFVLVDGVPGSGKTTAVVNAARQRGSGVFYFSASSISSLEADLHATFRSPMKSFQEHSPQLLQSTLRELATVCKDCTGKNLVVIVDNANRLSHDDANNLALLGKVGNDEKSYSIWLISNDEQPMLKACEAHNVIPERHRLPRPSKDELCNMIMGLLKGSREVAEQVVYFSGRSFTRILSFVKALDAGLPFQTPNIYPRSLDVAEQGIWRHILDAGEDGVDLRGTPGLPGLKEQLLAAKYKNCFDVSSSGPFSRLHPRTEHCRDVYRSFFAAMEYQDGLSRQKSGFFSIFSIASIKARELCNKKRNELDRIHSEINMRYDSLLAWSKQQQGKEPKILNFNYK